MNASVAPAEEPDLALAGAIPVEPTGTGQRIVTLDFIRGIAVLGILFPNIVAYAHPILAYFWPEGLPGGATEFDKATWLFQLVLIDGKFRGLFTLLFGAGMYLFIERVWARGGTRWLQARRLFWLMLFGLAHFFLLWIGDILFMYAIAGMVALAMLKWQAKTQLRIGIVWYLVGAFMLTAGLGSQAAMENFPRVQANAPEQYEQVRQAIADQLTSMERERTVMATGDYGEVLAYRAGHEAVGLAEAGFIAVLETIPLMLIGMAVYRLGWFERRPDRVKMRRWGWVGFVGGALLTVPLALLAVNAGFPLMLTQFVFNGPTQFLHLPMVLGLVALLSLWAPTAAQTWLGSRFAAAGRMAFSNYLGTSIVMMLVFPAWAGGLYGQFHRDGLLPFVLGMWVLMLGWSKWWLDRFHYGPLEWLWRCLTYWRLFPLRR